MELSEIKKKYVFTTKIELDSENYVELREPTQQELVKLGAEDGNELNVMNDLFPKCLIASSFTNNGKPATGEEVYAALKDSGSMLMEVLTMWLESVPFQRRLKKN